MIMQRYRFFRNTLSDLITDHSAHLFLLIALVVVSHDQARAGPVVLNGSFETPNLGNGWEYRPSGASWVFLDSSGITASNNSWGFFTAPQGTQAAILQNFHDAVGDPQQFHTGEFYQDVTGFQVGQSYAVSFMAT